MTDRKALIFHSVWLLFCFVFFAIGVGFLATPKRTCQECIRRRCTDPDRCACQEYQDKECTDWDLYGMPTLLICIGVFFSCCACRNIRADREHQRLFRPNDTTTCRAEYCQALCPCMHARTETEDSAMI